MSITFDEIKKQYIGRWRIRAWGSNFIVERKRWWGWSPIRKSDGALLTFKSIDEAKAYIDDQVLDRFVNRNKRGESKYTIYYP